MWLPGQVAGIDDGGETANPEGYCLLFHPDLLRGTSLARKMKEYTFFSYEVNEALHMSERERQTIFNCFTEIEEELHHSIDKHSRSIITSNIEVLLNHCLRFYDRQFATREAINRDVLTRFEELMADYFDSDKPEQIGLCPPWRDVPTNCISPPTISATSSRKRRASPPSNTSISPSSTVSRTCWQARTKP